MPRVNGKPIRKLLVTICFKQFKNYILIIGIKRYNASLQTIIKKDVAANSRKAYHHLNPKSLENNYISVMAAFVSIRSRNLWLVILLFFFLETKSVLVLLWEKMVFAGLARSILWPLAVLKTSGAQFYPIRTSVPVNNMFFFFDQNNVH